MQAKDISDSKVLRLIGVNHNACAFDELCREYPHKVVLAKYNKLFKKGLIDYGVSLQTAWLTDEGEKLLVGMM